MDTNDKRANAFLEAAKVYCKAKGLDFDEEGLPGTLLNLMTDALHYASKAKETVDLSEIAELSADFFSKERLS